MPRNSAIKCYFGCETKVNNKPCEHFKTDEEVVFQEHCIKTSQLKRISDDSRNYAKKLKLCADEPNRIVDNCYNDPAKHSQDDVDSDDFINTSDSDDECTIYVKLLATKLRKYSMYECYLIMYEIDGLLIKNPPGFDTSNTNGLRSATKPEDTLKPSIFQEHVEAEKTAFMRKKVTTESQIDTSPLTEEFYTIASQDTFTHHQTSVISTISPVNPKNVPVPSDKARSIPNLTEVTRNVQNPANVSTILDLPVKAQSICQQSAQVASVPLHIPLRIIIPENKLANSSEFVPSSYTKGKITIKKSSKYEALPQPPILITVPSLSEVVPPLSTQRSMISLDHLESSIDSQVNEIDLNLISHEVVISESGDS